MGNLQVIMETQASEMIQRSRPNTVEGSTSLFIFIFNYFFGAAGLWVQKGRGYGVPPGGGAVGGAAGRRALPEHSSAVFSEELQRVPVR